MLEISHLTVTRGGKHLLQDVGLSMGPGEIIALVGPNGAGKSTLLKAVSGEIRGYGGNIRIADDDRQHWKPRALAQVMAVMRQSSTDSFGFTAFELAALGLAPHGGSADRPGHRKIVLDALATVGLAGFENRVVPNLSGGERQRVFLARALVQITAGQEPGAPRLLLLDEPTSALDPAQQGVALRALRDLRARGVAALVVLHDLTLASLFADQVVLMKAGRILQQGRPRDVMTEALLAECYGCDLRIDRRRHDAAQLISINI